MLYPILKKCAYVFSRVWFRVSVAGAERMPRQGPVIVAANHLSLLDPALVGCVSPRELDYMAKAELFRIPGFAGLIRRLNAHPVDRTGSDSAALRLAIRLLEAGRAVLVFPEGTRSTGNRLGAARAGAGMLAALSQAPVLPVYIQGSDRALPRGAVMPRPSAITVTFGAPVRFARERGKARYQEISDEIMAAIGRIKREVEGQPFAVRGSDTDSTTAGRIPVSRIH